MQKKLIAWSVHAFTASGLLSAFMALLAAVDEDWRACMFWLLLCFVIDGVDGTFARLFKVREVLPHVQGKYIDYVIDFFTYVILPAYLFYQTTSLSRGMLLTATFAMLLSSALYYGIENMTSADGKHFMGFPALWNLVVYLLIFVFPDLSPTLTFCVIILLAIGHFVPILFAYPSQGGRWWPITLAATCIFIGAAIINVWYYPKAMAWSRWLSIISASYFVVLSLVDTFFPAKPRLQA